MPGCGGWEYAEGTGVPTLVYPAPKNGSFEGLSAEELVAALQHLDVTVLCLAGYLKVRSFGIAIAAPHRVPDCHAAHSTRLRAQLSSFLASFRSRFGLF